MPLALRNFFGVWGIPFLFFLNIGVTVGVVLLDAINPWLAVPVMWFWLYFHLLQTIPSPSITKRLSPVTQDR